MKIVYCGGLDKYPDAPDHLGIKQGFTVLGWDWYVVDPMLNSPSGGEVADRINDIAPDIVIHGNADSLSMRICSRVAKSTKQIFWMLDYRTPEMLGQKTWDFWTESAPYIDAVFISAGDHIPLWKEAFNCPTYFAPHACWIPPGLQYNEDFAYDVLFIGVRHDHGPLKARAELLKRISDLVPVTYLNGSGVKEYNLVWKMMPFYYYSSKVVLDVSHFWENWGYCSGRYWYTATLGGCAVTKRFPGCDNFFPDTLKWYFDTPEQAADLIKMLLNNDEERERTKRRASNYAWRNHSYKIRFQQMMRCLETGSQVPMY